VVWEVGTKGGLHLVIAVRNSKAETLGVGPHRAVARFIAQKKEPKLTLTELSKADHVDEAHFRHLLPKYEALTAEYRRARGFGG